MATMHERRAGAASILTALGRIPDNATPAEAQAAADEALSGHGIETASILLLNALGYEGYYYPAYPTAA